MTPPHDMTICAFQQLIRQRYFEADRARGTPSTFMWFIEEVGELATALQQPVSAKNRKNLEEEFADVFAWLCTLANIEGVDLTEAIRQKYVAVEGPTEHK